VIVKEQGKLIEWVKMVDSKLLRPHLLMLNNTKSGVHCHVSFWWGFFSFFFNARNVLPDFLRLLCRLSFVPLIVLLKETSGKYKNICMTHTDILVTNAFFRWMAYVSLIYETLVSFLGVGLYQNYYWMNYKIFTYYAEIQLCITFYLWPIFFNLVLKHFKDFIMLGSTNI